MEKEKSCGAIVYRLVHNEIQYLILKSTNPDGHWGFAKGHMEGNETEEETCIREVFEEAGININIDKGFRSVEKYNVTEEVEKEVVIFIGNAKNQTVKIQVEEIAEYKWYGYKEAMDLITFDGSKNILREGNKFLEENISILGK